MPLFLKLPGEAYAICQKLASGNILETRSQCVFDAVSFWLIKCKIH